MVASEKVNLDFFVSNPAYFLLHRTLPSVSVMAINACVESTVPAIRIVESGLNLNV